MITAAEADALAASAHGQARNKSGMRFIDHVRRVAQAMATDDDPYAVPAALLHDTVEKGAITWADLRDAGADDRLVDVVDALTERPGESTTKYFRRCAADPLALRIKAADLADKFDLGPTVDLSREDRERIKARAVRRLAKLERVAAAHGAR